MRFGIGLVILTLIDFFTTIVSVFLHGTYRKSFRIWPPFRGLGFVEELEGVLGRKLKAGKSGCKPKSVNQ